MKTVLFASLLALAVSLTCTGTQVYLQITRTIVGNPTEEEHYIYGGYNPSSPGTPVITSPIYEPSSTRAIEYCLDARSDFLWSLKMVDKYPDGWAVGSSIKLFNEYGVCIFARNMMEREFEWFKVLLYIPVKKGASNWKFINSATGSWATESYTDSAWTTVKLPLPSGVSTAGTQYFRMKFTGNIHAAAIDIMMNYRFGVLVHLMGAEVFRDNMEPGVVESTTLSTASYSEYSYRGVMRAANAVDTATTVILAVECHFPSTMTTIDFDAWVAIYSSTQSDPAVTNCYSVYFVDTADITGTVGNNAPSVAHNLVKNDMWSMNTVSLTAPCSIIFTSPTRFIQFNGYEIFPFSSTNYMPRDANVMGTKTAGVGSTYYPIADLIDIPFMILKVTRIWFPFTTTAYKSYRLSTTRSYSASLRIFEMQPLICNVDAPTFFTMLPANPARKFFIGIDNVNLYPDVYGVNTCTINPSLPSGLTFSPANCRIGGMATGASSLTTYTITSTTLAVSGTIQFETLACPSTSSVLYLTRTYAQSSTPETFAIYNAATDALLFEEKAGTNQVDGSTISRLVCMAATRFKLVVGSTNYLTWQLRSTIKISDVLDTEFKTITLVRYDLNINLNPIVYFSAYKPIPAVSTWLYKHAYSSADWYSTSTSGWSSATRGNFGVSTNQYQVYRKSFDILAAELSLSGAFVLSLKFQYGIIVYINEVEVYRCNVADGALNTITAANAFYSTAMYRQVSLATKSMKIGETASQQILKSGTNTIAVALIAQAATQTGAVFDASLRLNGIAEDDKSFDVSVTGVNMSNVVEIMSKYYAYTIAITSCAAPITSITFVLADDRREWVNGIEIANMYNAFADPLTQFEFYGKNAVDATWQPLVNVTGMKWWVSGQHKKVLFPNNRAFNMFKVEKLLGLSATVCAFKINGIYLLSTKTDMELSPLTYKTPSESFKDVELAEFFPLTGSEGRFNFRTQDVLPEGLFIDPPTGVMIGTPLALSAQRPYTFVADSVDGTSVSFTFQFEVIVCTGGKSLISIIFRTDTNPLLSFYKLYAGRNTVTGNPIEQKSGFAMSSARVWLDLCLDYNDYTFQWGTTFTNGLNFPGGMWMTVDRDSMFTYFQMMNAEEKTKTVSFSSFLPFELEVTTWKVYTAAAELPSSWNTVLFADANWLDRKTTDTDMGVSASVTLYYRKKFSINKVDNYPVLNVHMLHSGGVLAFFNGNRVARFLLPTAVSTYTEATAAHDETKYSQFNVILLVKGGVDGDNVIAFETHRATGTSSASAHVFDATGMFGIEQCNIIKNDFTEVSGVGSASMGNRNQLFDGQIDVLFQLGNAVSNTVEWVMGNLERSQFNAFYMNNLYRTGTMGFSIDGKHSDNESDFFVELLNANQPDFADRVFARFDVNLGMAGFRYYMWMLNNLGTYSVTSSEWSFGYCKVSGDVCPAIGDYPAVVEGQISPSTCPLGWTGYSYRNCTGGKLGVINVGNCDHIMPGEMSYPSALYSLVRDVEVRLDAPIVEGYIERFYLDAGDLVLLPHGLFLDAVTGQLYGTPIAVTDGVITVVVRAENTKGATSSELMFVVRVGRCQTVRNFDETVVGNTAHYECSRSGSYVGTQHRECKLLNGVVEWQAVKGSCISVALIVVLVVVVVLVVLVVVFVVVRTRKTASKKKGKGGSVKSRKEKKNGKESNV